jgi:ribose 5-phosphate isomerase A
VTTDPQALKQAVAQAAVDYIEPWLTSDAVIGVGTGSTADLFIDALCLKRGSFRAAVASSERTAERLRQGGVTVLTLNDVASMPVYVDDASKQVEWLGRFPLPIEVLPMAVASVMRRAVALGGQPSIRTGFVTDNGNPIVDVAGLKILDAPGLEVELNNLPGVVTNGIFALRRADVALVAGPRGVETLLSH